MYGFINYLNPLTEREDVSVVLMLHRPHAGRVHIQQWGVEYLSLFTEPRAVDIGIFYRHL